MPEDGWMRISAQLHRQPDTGLGAKLKAKSRRKLKAKTRRKLEANRPTTHWTLGAKLSKTLPKANFVIMSQTFQGICQFWPTTHQLDISNKAKSKS